MMNMKKFKLFLSIFSLVSSLSFSAGMSSAVAATITNVKSFGASGSAQTTMGTITAGSKTLQLSSPIDFKNGMGIFVPNAGSVPTLSTPNAPHVAIDGGPSGSSTYGYEIVAIDSQGGGTAASSEGTITNGPSTLGGLGPNGSGAGIKLYKAQFLGISIQTVSGAQSYAIYRTKAPVSSGLSTGFLGMYTIANTPFLDYGQAVKTPPPGVPATPPTKAFGDSLVSTIQSGGGTTTLTLSNPAITSVSNAIIRHDDTKAFEAALATNPTNLYIPAGTYGISSPITDTTANSTIYGDGSTSLLQFQGNADAQLTLSASGQTLENVGFNGGDITNSLVTVASSQSLSHMTIQNTTGTDSVDGITVNNKNTEVSGVVDSYITMTGNSYYNCEYTYTTIGAANHITITNNQAGFTDYNYSGRTTSLHNWDSTGGYTFAQNFTIEGNTFYAGNHSAAIVIQGSGTGMISNNNLFISGGIFGVWGIGAGQDVSAAGGYTITKNYIQALWTGTGVAINLSNLVNVGVSQNDIIGFGYGFEAGGYGSGGFPDSPSNNVSISNNTTSQISISSVLGTPPQSVQVSGTTNVANLPTLPIAPAAPTTLSHSQVTGTSWTETWTPVSNAASYNVYLNGTKINSNPITGTSYSITGQAPNLSYVTQVVAVNSGGVSPMSSSDVVTPTYNLPTSPTGLLHTKITTTGWTETWAPVTGSNLGTVTYAVYVNGNQVGTTLSPTYTFTGGTPGNSYTMAIGALNGSGKTSPLSSADTIKTNDNIGAFPTGLSHSAISSTGWTETWSPVTGSNIGTVTYGVYVNGSEITTTSSPTYTFTGETPGTTYAVSISSINGSGQSSLLSTSDNVTTLYNPSGVPTGLNHKNVMTSGWEETWNAVTGTKIGNVTYRIYLNNSLAGTTSSNSYAFTGENSGKTYAVTIESVNGSGETSALSEVDAVTTLTPTPPPSGGGGNVTPPPLPPQSPPSILTTSLAGSAKVDQSYSATLQEDGGTSPYVWSVVQGTLPPGITLSAQGMLSGTPTKSGTFPFTVQIQGGNGLSSTKSFLLSVSPPPIPLSINSNFYGSGRVNQPFQLSVNASGGSTPYEWILTGGQLPSGLQFNTQTGIISGTPTRPGIVSLPIMVKDSQGQTADTAVTLDFISSAVREVLWKGTPVNVPSFVGKEGKTMTTYMPIWYVMHLLKTMGITSVWHHKQWNLQTSTTTNVTDFIESKGNTTIYLNGAWVRKVNTIVQLDPWTHKPTTFMPIWYVMQVLNQVHLQSHWNGIIWTVTN